MTAAALRTSVLLAALISCAVTHGYAQQRSSVAVEIEALSDSLAMRSGSDSLPGARRRTVPLAASALAGLLTGTAALVGLMAATWDNPEGLLEPVVWVGFGLGTAAGAAAMTSVWEKPNRGLLIGALVGAAPLLVAATADDDDVAGASLIISWIAAPLGAAIGQAVRRR